MKLIIISLLSFFWTLSAYADLQWVPYNPAGDYGDKVLVIGVEVVFDGKRTRSYGICRTLDAQGEVRVGRVKDNKCHYAIDLFVRDIISRSKTIVSIYEGGTSDKFDVLVALSHNDYMWIDIGPDDDLRDSILPFNAAGDESSPEIYVCRHIDTGHIAGKERAVFYVGQSYEDIYKSGCYYEYFSSGRRKFPHQILGPAPHDIIFLF